MSEVRATQAASGQVLADPGAFLALAFAWAGQGWIRDLDAALAHRLALLSPDADTPCLLAAVMASHQAGQGHLLLDLQHAREQPRELIAVATDPLAQDGTPPILPETLLSQMGAGWESRLRDWSAVGEGAGSEPLVLVNGRLYLRRYWRNEVRVEQAISARLDTPVDVDLEALRDALDQLFPPDHHDAQAARWQKLACALGARSSFAVITGGPGTGKTTTVVRLLALLQVLAMEAGTAPLRIRLAAPTGKAAARLNGSIRAQIGQLADLDLPQADRVCGVIPAEVTTLHRLLGARPDTRRFRYHRFNPLPLDMVVVDEASMVDIEMMAALLDALPPQARLVVLGDKDQLASVEAGAVLGSLCARAERAHYRPELARWLESATGHDLPLSLQDDGGRPIDQAVAMLRHSFRFEQDSGIGQLARSVNAGDSRAAQRVLADDTAFPEVRQLAAGAASFRGLAALALHGWQCDGARGYSHYLETIRDAARPATADGRVAWGDWAAGILSVHAGFQLLTPLRSGRYGVEALNGQIESALAREGLIARPDAASDWYEGRPVLVTGNDYGLGLMNGDIGIALRAPVEFGRAARGETLRVAFAAGDGGIRWVLPSRLQHIETVYAMTVHKSQGSEFVHTALVMPDTLSPVLTRELVYTAVTRAKQSVTVLCTSEDVLRQAIERRVARLGSGPGPGPGPDPS